MKNRHFIGIDVSKDTLDLFIRNLNFHFIVKNTPRGFSEFLEVCCNKLNCKPESLYFCFEDTGRYSRPLAVFLSEADILFTMAQAFDMKRSMGLKRGKSDRLDAKAIAKYAWQKRDDIRPTKLNSGMVAQLRQLLALRDKLIKHRTAYKSSIKDLHDSFFVGETAFLKESQKRMIAHLTDELNSVES